MGGQPLLFSGELNVAPEREMRVRGNLDDIISLIATMIGMTFLRVAGGEGAPLMFVIIGDNPPTNAA